MEIIRIGTVSAVDKDTGMVSVVYQDQDDGTTGYLPYFSPGDEYKPPAVNDMVLVAHLSNGTTRGIVIGKFWNKANKPPVPDTGWYKKLSEKSSMRYEKESDTLYITAPKIVLECGGKVINVTDLAGE